MDPLIPRHTVAYGLRTMEVIVVRLCEVVRRSNHIQWLRSSQEVG